jgi:hypothetical protein
MEDARKRLTVLLLDAKQTHHAVSGNPEAWRARSRSTGIDVTARVVWEGPLAVVVSAVVRSVPTESSWHRNERRQR